MKIEIELEEAKRVFRLLEEFNELLHQPLNYEDTKYVTAFAASNSPESKELYYNAAWNWLPQETKREIAGE